MEDTEQFYCPIKTEQSIKDDDDVIDLAVYDEYEWNATVMLKLKETVSMKTESSLNALMKWYYQSLLEAEHFDDANKLKNYIMEHINTLRLYFASLKCSFKNNYMSNMESILSFYITIELRAVPRKGTFNVEWAYKKYVHNAIRRIRFLLDTNLYGREERIYHVLMKMKYPTITDEMKDLLNALFKCMLVCDPKNQSVLAFCRAYILFQKWKKIRDCNDWEQMDSLVYGLYNRTAEFIRENKLLNSILTPESDSFVDLVTLVTENYVVITERYFNYIASVEAQDSEGMKEDRLQNEILQEDWLTTEMTHAEKLLADSLLEENMDSPSISSCIRESDPAVLNGDVCTTQNSNVSSTDAVKPSTSKIPEDVLNSLQDENRIEQTVEISDSYLSLIHGHTDSMNAPFTGACISMSRIALNDDDDDVDDDIEEVKCHQETVNIEDDDDCTIVNVIKHPPTMLIHEVTNDDDICEIIMPDIYVKRRQNKFLSSLKENKQNNTSRNENDFNQITPLDRIIVNKSESGNLDDNDDCIISVESPYQNISHQQTAEKICGVLATDTMYSEISILHSPSSTSTCVVENITKDSSKETWSNTVEILSNAGKTEGSDISGANQWKATSTVETQTEVLYMEEDDNLIRQTQQDYEPNQSLMTDISVRQKSNDKIGSENSRISADNILDNTEKVDSTASCSTESIPQVSKDSADDNVSQRPDSNQIDSPENSILSNKSISTVLSLKEVTHIDSSLFPLSTISTLNKQTGTAAMDNSLASPDISSTSVDVHENEEINSSGARENINEINENCYEPVMTNGVNYSDDEQISVDLNLAKENSVNTEESTTCCKDDKTILLKELRVVLSKNDTVVSEPENDRVESEQKKCKVMFTSPRKITKDFSKFETNLHVIWNKCKDIHGLQDFLSGPVTDKVNVSNGYHSMDSFDWFGNNNSNKQTAANIEPSLTPPPSTSPNASSEITSPAFEEGLDDFRTFFEEKHEGLKENNSIKSTNNFSKKITVKNIKSLQQGKRKRILFADNIVDSNCSRTHSPTEASNKVVHSILKKPTVDVNNLRNYPISENINYTSNKKSRLSTSDLRIHRTVGNNNSIVRDVLDKSLDINKDSESYESLQRNKRFKNILPPEISHLKVNFKQFEFYNIKPDDRKFHYITSVTIKKLTDEEIHQSEKLSEISRRIQSQKERKQQISHPISSLVRVDYDKHTTQISDKDVVRFNFPNPWNLASSPTPWRSVASPFLEQEEGTVSSCNSELSENTYIQCQNFCCCNNIALDIANLSIPTRNGDYQSHLIDKSVSYSYPIVNPFMPRPGRTKRKHSEESANSVALAPPPTLLPVPTLTPDVNAPENSSESNDNLNSSLNLDIGFVSELVENFEKECLDFILDVSVDKDGSGKEKSNGECIEKTTKSDDVNKMVTIPADLHNLNLRKFSPSPVIHCVSPQSNSPNHVIVSEYDINVEKQSDLNTDTALVYNLGNDKIDEYMKEKLNGYNKGNLYNCEVCSNNLNRHNYHQISDTITEYRVNNKQCCVSHDINNLIPTSDNFDVKNQNVGNYCVPNQIINPEQTVRPNVIDLNTTVEHSENYLCQKYNTDYLSNNKIEIINNTYGDENANHSFATAKERDLTPCHFDIARPNFPNQMETETAKIESIVKYKELPNEEVIEKPSKATHKIETSINDLEDIETRLPLKKRKLSVANNKEETEDEDYMGPDLVEEIIRRARAEKIEKDEISYPAKPMISIAEIQENLTEPQPRVFKTPAEKKEMPSAKAVNTPKIITEQYNNHTYNNPTINYHMNNVPYPFFPCASLSYFPSILLPYNSTTTFDMNLVQQPMKNPEAQNVQEVKTKRKEDCKGRRKNKK